MDDLSGKILACIEQIVGMNAHALDLDTNLHSVGLDSLGRVSVVSYLEHSLQMQLSTDQTLGVFESSSVRDLISVLAATVDCE
jgi:acyl carrier protein